ncbi:MAG: Crp/Fnr family transcriptional regulator [Eubacterium sp.]|nr:Crp/Fnr family transcriptional regulator [Eubacterium sp.]
MQGIENLFLFKGLSNEEIAMIITVLPKPQKFIKGEEIYNHRKFNKAIGIILSGKAEAIDGALLKRSFVKGDVFGAAALFGNEESYISKIVAKSDTEIQFISEDILEDLFKRYPETAVNYIEFLSQKVRFLNKRINLYSQKTASAKLYQFLTENADENNTYTGANMSKLAALTSIGRTSLYRAIDELTEAGMIEKSGTTIIVK